LDKQFEAKIQKRDKWYVGWVDEVPGAFSQGRTVRETQESLQEAVALILESRRELGLPELDNPVLKRKILVRV
jgi:predicted RNase H-like HicB family nuclease